MGPPPVLRDYTSGLAKTQGYNHSAGFLVGRAVRYNIHMKVPGPTYESIRSRADALILAVLLIARLRIDTLAEASALPFRLADSSRHPLLGRLMTDEAEALLSQQGLVTTGGPPADSGLACSLAGLSSGGRIRSP